MNLLDEEREDTSLDILQSNYFSSHFYRKRTKSTNLNGIEFLNLQFDFLFIQQYLLSTCHVLGISSKHKVIFCRTGLIHQYPLI